MLAAQPDRRRIDDRHHLFDIARQQRVKQDFVRVLQSSQKRIFLQVAMKSTKSVKSALHLIIKLRNMRRQQSVQVELVSLGFGESCTFIEQRIVKQLVTA